MKILLLARKVFTHRYVALIFRLYIGGLFIYASLYKLHYVGEFAESIASYQMVPYWGVNILAVTLPWIELICGTLLIIGVRARSATITLGTLLVMFSIAIMINLWRDIPISCGCFHTLEEKISWWTLGRDLIWVLMTIHVFFYDRALHLERRFSLILKEI